MLEYLWPQVMLAYTFGDLDFDRSLPVSNPHDVRDLREQAHVHGFTIDGWTDKQIDQLWVGVGHDPVRFFNLLGRAVA